MIERDFDSWVVGDPMIEWGGRAEGMDDQQIEFSDINQLPIEDN